MGIKIIDIIPGMSNLMVKGKITNIYETRKVKTKKYGFRNVAKVELTDETCSIMLNLWGNQILQVKNGDHIKLENAFSNEFEGLPELQIGREGQILHPINIEQQRQDDSRQAE